MRNWRAWLAELEYLKADSLLCVDGVATMANRCKYNSIPPKAPGGAGAFYFFNIPQSTKNALQYLAPSPTANTDFEPL